MGPADGHRLSRIALMALDSVISLICNHVFQIPFPAGSRWDGGGEAEPSGVQYQGYC